jgi:hypothetical protein
MESTAGQDIICGLLFMLPADVVRLWRKTHPDHVYTDEQAIDEYMAVNWAWREYRPAKPEPPELPELETTAEERAPFARSAQEAARTGSPRFVKFLADYVDRLHRDFDKLLSALQSQPESGEGGR